MPELPDVVNYVNALNHSPDPSTKLKRLRIQFVVKTAETGDPDRRAPFRVRLDRKSFGDFLRCWRILQRFHGATGAPLTQAAHRA